MRDVNAGYILRYTHANVASFFFIFVYAHIARGLFYSSYRTPRVLVWNIGVIIFILMMATAFLGYVLPYGQMSLWGWPNLAPNAYLINKLIFIMKGCLDKTINFFIMSDYLNSLSTLTSIISIDKISNKNIMRIPALKRIGPHNKDILSILFGSLLGDCHAEYRSKGNGTRFCFYQESSHTAYLLWLHSLLADLNYCNPLKPEIQTRLGQKGRVRKIIRFKTWTYSSLNWVHELWYSNNTKIVPSTIGDYLNPLALAIWIMDDGCKCGKGLKLSTNSFTYSDCMLLVKVLFDKFKIKSSIQSAGWRLGKAHPSKGSNNETYDQYNIYIWKESIPLTREIVLPYVHPSMKYKLLN